MGWERGKFSRFYPGEAKDSFRFPPQHCQRFANPGVKLPPTTKEGDRPFCLHGIHRNPQPLDPFPARVCEKPAPSAAVGKPKIGFEKGAINSLRCHYHRPGFSHKTANYLLYKIGGNAPRQFLPPPKLYSQRRSLSASMNSNPRKICPRFSRILLKKIMKN
jgi:hypothetical protein